MKKLLLVVAFFTLAIGTVTGVLAAENRADAKVRIVHASPDAPAVDVYVDGTAVVQGAEFKDATDYLPLKAGEYKVEIYPAGKKDKAVLTQKVKVEAGKAYTVAAANKLANLELVIAEDSTEASPGKAKVRVGHLSPDAPTVDVGLKGGDALFSGASFKGITDYKEVDPGTYDLEIRTPEGKKVLDLTGTKLEADTVYTVLAVNTANQLEVLVLIDSEK